MSLKVLIGVNLIQLAKPFDRDTRSSSVVVVSYSAVCKDITINYDLAGQWLAENLQTVKLFSSNTACG